MSIHFLRRPKKIPPQGLTLAYEAAIIRFCSWVNSRVRQWETQPLPRRKRQLILCLAGLLTLGSLSVYYTASGHFFTRINQKHHEQHPNVRYAGAGPLRRK